MASSAKAGQGAMVAIDVAIDKTTMGMFKMFFNLQRQLCFSQGPPLAGAVIYLFY